CLNESYKRLHHFVNSKTKDSLWVKNVSEIIKNEFFVEFKNDFEKISSSILNYEDEFQNDQIKYERDIFVHYQGSPIDVYEAYNNIDILILIKNTTKYLNLISEIIKF